MITLGSRTAGTLSDVDVGERASTERTGAFPVRRSATQPGDGELSLSEGPQPVGDPTLDCHSRRIVQSATPSVTFRISGSRG